MAAIRTFAQAGLMRAPLLMRQRATVCVSFGHRLYSAQAEEAPKEEYSAKIQKLVKEISALNLMEVAELTSCLKSTLNISDVPMMAMGGAMPAASAPAAAPAAEEEKKPEQTEFTVKLVKIDEKEKVKIIREVKNLVANLNLVQAKKFVESLPQTVKENIPKDEAEKIKKALEAAGGVIELS